MKTSKKLLKIYCFQKFTDENYTVEILLGIKMKFLKELAKITERDLKKYLEQKKNNSNRIIKIIAKPALMWGFQY